MMTNEIKSRIIEKMREQQKLYPSAAKFAVSLDINAAQLSRVLKGDSENVISDAKWLSIARKLDVQISENKAWQVAKTQVFNHIYGQLDACQNFSISALLCDRADIGKTFAAKVYVREHKNAVYIDCSQVKSKQKLIRQMAKEFGLINIGKYSEVYEDLVFYLKSSATPLIILDEAGDLDYPAFLELKALWNATERCVGWYMMGADGLKAKIESNLSRKKVGYAELFSRFGSRYQRITPDGADAYCEFVKMQVATIAKANGATDVQSIYAKTAGSLRRIVVEIQKLKLNNKAA